MKPPPAIKEIRTLADLTPDPQNARAHTSRNIGLIADSLQEVGFARSIVIDEGGVILAGNGVAEAAGQVGMEAVRVVEADGDELIVVRRANLTPAQKTRLALFDNRATDLSSFDPAVLATLDPPLLEGLWREDELARLLGDAEPIDPAALWQGMPEFAHEDQTADAAFTIRVFLKDADALAALGRLLGKDLTGHKAIWFGKQPQGTTYEVFE